MEIFFPHHGKIPPVRAAVPAVQFFLTSDLCPLTSPQGYRFQEKPSPTLAVRACPCPSVSVRVAVPLGFRFQVPGYRKSQLGRSVAALAERRGCSVPPPPPSHPIHRPCAGVLKAALRPFAPACAPLPQKIACVVCVSFAPFALKGCSAVPAVRFPLTSDLCILTSPQGSR